MKRCVRMAAELRRQEREGRRAVARVLKRRRPLVEKTPVALKPALAMVDANRFADAREFVADFLEKSPGHASGHALLIRIHGMLREIGLSEHLFDHAQKNGMENRGIYCALVDAYANCGQFPKALEVIFDAAKYGMDDIRSYINFMSGLYDHGMYRAIIGFYSLIPTGWRERPSIKVRYADALRKLKRYDEAIEVAELSLRMRGTLGDMTMAKIIIGYCETERGNPKKAYEVLNEVYEKISAREDGGVSFGFFPRLLCGMAYACRRGRIPLPDPVVERWRGLLEEMQSVGRGKEEDVENALVCLDRIPSVPAQQAL